MQRSGGKREWDGSENRRQEEQELEAAGTIAMGARGRSSRTAGGNGRERQQEREEAVVRGSRGGEIRAGVAGSGSSRQQEW